MSTKSITAFFQPKGKAKKKPEDRDDLVGEEEAENSPKKSKQSEGTAAPSSSTSSTSSPSSSQQSSTSSPALSQDQKEAIEKKKMEAALKLALKKGLPLPSTVGAEWSKILTPEFNKKYYKDLMTFLEDEVAKKVTIYPPAPDVFSWTRACTPKQIKVVILGQDPYIKPNQAHGLSFSVPKGTAIPPSLKNIYKELESDIPGFKAPSHGNLMSWAEQGVLLLNSALTVRAGNSNSHAGKGWEKLTEHVVAYLNERKANIVFILWGNFAKKKGKKVNKKKHLVLEGGHPSPLSVRYFLGCKHFSKANDYLRKAGKTPINWGSVCEQS